MAGAITVRGGSVDAAPHVRHQAPDPISDLVREQAHTSMFFARTRKKETYKAFRAQGGRGVNHGTFALTPSWVTSTVRLWGSTRMRVTVGSAG